MVTTVFPELTTQFKVVGRYWWTAASDRHPYSQLREALQLHPIQLLLLFLLVLSLDEYGPPAPHRARPGDGERLIKVQLPVLVHASRDFDSVREGVVELAVTYAMPNLALIASISR